MRTIEGEEEPARVSSSFQSSGGGPRRRPLAVVFRMESTRNRVWVVKVIHQGLVSGHYMSSWPYAWAC